MIKQNPGLHQQDIPLEVPDGNLVYLVLGQDIHKDILYQFVLKNQTLNVYYMLGLIGTQNSAVHHQDVAFEVPGGDLVDLVILVVVTSLNQSFSNNQA